MPGLTSASIPVDSISYMPVDWFVRACITRVTRYNEQFIENCLARDGLLHFEMVACQMHSRHRRPSGKLARDDQYKTA